MICVGIMPRWCCPGATVSSINLRMLDARTWGICAIIAHMPQVDARFIGTRIQEERKLAGLSQEELGQQAGLDRTVVNKVENGTRKVTALELSDIATALGVRMMDFFAPPAPALVSHRSSQGLDVADSQIDRLLAHLSREVEFVAGLFPELFGAVIWSEVTALWNAPESSAESEALAIRARSLLGVVSSDPLTDLATCAANIGLLVFSRDIGNDTADAGTILLERGGVSLINSNMKVGRRRLALAHEIGHYLIADEYSVDWRVASSAVHESSLESRLDRFARALLLPQSALAQRWESVVDAESARVQALKLASEFRVDMATLARRLLELGLVDEGRAQQVRRTRTKQADIIELNLLVPVEELENTSVPSSFAAAVLRLVRDERISRERALQLLQGTFDDEDLPEPRLRREHEIWDFVS